MTVCARYDVLRALAHASGVEQITLWALPEQALSSEFSDQEPSAGMVSRNPFGISRVFAFVNLGAAAHIAYGIAHAPIMIVNMSKALQK